MKNTLLITDSLTKEKKRILLNDLSLKLYVCGITPSDEAHIGHGRCYLAYDVLVRLIRFLNFKIIYVRNVTDINEKLNIKAKELYDDEKKFFLVAEHYYQIFRNNMRQLNCLEVDCTPRVTDSIDAIIECISAILNAGYAYERADGIYFDVKKFKQYGELSKRMEQVAEETVSRLIDLHQKESLFDFVLWKKHDEEPCWMSPWGKGTPGWHIECSAMIKKSFDEKTIDIHGGGLDLIFPHHENEKAQTECVRDYPLARIWMHVSPVQVNKQKMSKSLGNSITLNTLFGEYDPMVIRFYLLMHNYTSPMDFNITLLDQVKKNYIQVQQVLTTSQEKNNSIEIENDFEKNYKYIVDDMYDFLCDDLNTAAVIGFFFKYKKEISENAVFCKRVKEIFQFILGLTLLPLKEEKMSNHIVEDEIKLLLEERDKARAQKDFSRSDELREILKKKGYIIKDEKSNK